MDPFIANESNNVDNLFGDYVPGLGTPPPEKFMQPEEANEKALYAIGSKDIDSFLGEGTNFLADLNRYSNDLQTTPRTEVLLSEEQHNTYLTDNYVKETGEYIPELMANKDISKEDKKSYIKKYMEMINEPTRNEALDNQIEELQKAQYIKNVASFPKESINDTIDQLNITTNLYPSLSEQETLAEMDEDYNTFTEEILPFFKKTDLSKSQVYKNLLEDFANPFGVTRQMEEGFKDLPGSFTSDLYKGVDFLNNKLDKDGTINWNASLARIAYEPIAFGDFLLSIPAFLARGIVDEIIPSVKGLAFPEQWEKIKKERLLEQLKPTDQIGFWRTFTRGLDLLPVEQHIRSWIKNRTAITEEEKEEYLLRVDNTMTDAGLKGLEWGIDSMAEIMDATGFSDSKSKAKSLLLSAMVFFGVRGLGKKAALRLENTKFVRQMAAKARKKRRDKEEALAARALTDLKKPIKVKTVGPEAPNFTMKTDRKGKETGPITDVDIIDINPTNFKYTGNNVKPGSSLDITVRANPQLGSVIAASILKEAKASKSGGVASEAASFFNTTPTMLLNSYYFNPLEIGGNLTNSITLYHEIAEKILDSQFIHPVVYTIPNRKAKMDTIEKVLRELAPKQYHQEISNLGFTPLDLNEAAGLTANQINIMARYGKSANSLIFTIPEAIEGYNYIYNAVSKQITDPKVYIEEHIPAGENILHTIEDFKNIPTNYLKGNAVTIRWDYKTVFDPLANSIFGPQSILPETTYYGLPLGYLQRSKYAGSWMNRNGLVPSWYLTADLYNRNQVQRALKPFNEAVNALVKQNPKQLFEIINKGHRENKEISYDEVVDMFKGTNIYSDGKALENVYRNYKKYRSLNDLVYNISNKAIRESMIKDGIDTGLFRTGDIKTGEGYSYLEGVNTNFTLPKGMLQIQQKPVVNKQATSDLFNKTEITDDVVLDSPNLRVWEYETNNIVDFDYAQTLTKKNTDGAIIETRYTDTQGKILVKLYQPKSMDIGNGIKSITNYALIDPAKYKLLPLPSKVLNYNPGQVHIVHTDPWFVTLRPSQLIVDGKVVEYITTNTVKDVQALKELDKYTEVLHKASSESIAKELVEKIKDEYPGYEVSYKQAAESPSDLLQVTDNYLTSVSSTKQRSEHMMERDLNSLTVMDPLQSLVQSYSNSVKAGLTVPVENTLQALWEDPQLGMREFLIDGKVPTSLDLFETTFKGSIKAGNRMAYDSAHQLLIYRELMRSKETFEERGITEALEFVKKPILSTIEIIDNTVMDLARVSSKGAVRTLSPATLKAIEISNSITGKSIVNVANAGVSTVYIALNALRQPFVQNTQLVTYLVANPHRAVQQMSQLIAIALRLIVGKLPKSAMNTATGMATRDISNAIIKSLGAATKEFKYFEESMQGLLESGVLETIDMNLMVEALTSSITGPKLKPTKLDKLKGMATAGPKVVVSIVQQSFNLSEGMQRIFFYKRAEEILLDRMPADKRLPALKSATFIADVTKAGFDFAGSQAESGKFNYQEGLPGVMGKFAAIMQKIQNNVAQGGKSTYDANGKLMRESGSATIWTAAERARFGAAQAITFGKYGLVFGSALTMSIDSIDENDYEGETKEILTYLKDPKTKALIEGGIINPVANFILNNGFVENTEFYKIKINEYNVLLKEGKINKSLYDSLVLGLKQNINYSASVAPVGPKGQPFVPIAIALQIAEGLGWKDSPFNQAGFKFPLIQMLKGQATTLMRTQMYFSLRELTDEDFMDAFPSLLAPSLSAFNNYMKTTLAQKYGDLYSKSGQPINLNIENPKIAAAMAFGFQPESTTNYYDILQKIPNDSQAYKDEAKQINEGLKALELRLVKKDGNTRTLTIDEKLAIRDIIIQSAGNKFSNPTEAMGEIGDELRRIERRVLKPTGQSSLIERIIQQSQNDDLPKGELSELKSYLVKLRQGLRGADIVEADRGIALINAMQNLRRANEKTKEEN